MSWLLRVLPYHVFFLSLSLMAGCSESPPRATLDASLLPDDTDATASGPGDGDGAHPGDDPEGACAKLDARPEPKVSVVWLVIDPNSLLAKLPTQDGTERRNGEVLREFLFGDMGVVPELQSAVRFGLVSYGSTYAIIGGLPNPNHKCPTGVLVPPAYDAADALTRAYDEDLPPVGLYTWASMQQIVPLIEAQDEPTQNTVLLMQSGSEEQNCELFQDGPGLLREAVADAARLGAKVSVLSLLYHPSEAPQSEQWNREARERGRQLSALGNGEAFELVEVEPLRQALRKVVTSAVSCELKLQGKVRPGGECHGDVRLNGSAIPCDEKNGYRLLDASTLELTGTSCDALRASPQATLSARFPCDVFVLF